MNFDFMTTINDHIQEALKQKENEALILQANALNSKLNKILFGISVGVLFLCFCLETPH